MEEYKDGTAKVKCIREDGNRKEINNIRNCVSTGLVTSTRIGVNENSVDNSFQQQ